MDSTNIIETGGFFFIHDFDSGNLGHVERVPSELIISSVNHRTNLLETPEYEFNIWTRPDCAGTEFENGNRTWFYFGIQGGKPSALIRLNILNLNKQNKMYNQGMAPVTRVLPGKPQWERIKDRPIHSSGDNMFMLSFKYKTPENMKATTFFAFTYPFSFAELQIALNSIDMRFLPLSPSPNPDDIYYCRECLIYSLEGRRVDLITISSYHGITKEREPRIKHLFPEKEERPFKFVNKKVIFMSARVHPGETPSSFVFNGFLHLLLNRTDPVAIHLRRYYVFKMVPFLNPDGVARGHYRTDTRGVNLNRVYLNPSLHLHPTIYAARSLILFYHYGFEVDDDFERANFSRSLTNINEEGEQQKKKRATPLLKQSDNKRVDTKKTSNNKFPLQPSRTKTPKKENRGATPTSSTESSQQQNDVKVQEIKTQTDPKPSQVDKSSTTLYTANNIPEKKKSLLDSVVIRDCLGSEVHLTRSDELSKLGPNPLRELRETLKNSISLLIGTNTYNSSLQSQSVALSSDPSKNGSCNLKMGFCPSCTGKCAMSETPQSGGSTRCQVMLSENLADTSADYMFCTNCLRRYSVTSENCEKELTVIEKNPSTTSSTASGEDKFVSDSSSRETIQPYQEANKVKPRTPKAKKKPIVKPPSYGKYLKEPESGLFLYIDLHGHASKKGIFMYGNHFDDVESSVECMLLPRIMSLNNLHFHFSSCNFTEKNMYLKDRRDGMSREGSGRVAVLKTTGLVRSYTLECNYNTGRMVNILPPPAKESANTPPTLGTPQTPPHYTPHLFEEVNALQVGKSLGASILDLTNQHPNSRIPGSEHRTLASIRDWLRQYARNMHSHISSRARNRNSSPNRVPIYARTYTKPKLSDTERKENTYVGAKTEQGSNDLIRKPKAFSYRTTTRYFSEPTPPKSRSIISRPMRKSTSKLLLKKSRLNDGDASTTKRIPKLSRKSVNLKASSSEELAAAWREVYTAKRPRAELTHHHHLKKIRLKSTI